MRDLIQRQSTARSSSGVRSSSPSDTQRLLREKDNEIRQLRDHQLTLERTVADKESELGEVRGEYDKLIVDYEQISANQQRIEDEWQN